MLKSTYKRILKKLNLSKEELKELETKLTPENISAGPFVSGTKMCPNTNALSIKLRKMNFENEKVRKALKERGIRGLELSLFYILFDIPAKISRKIKAALLKKLRKAVGELL